MSLIRLKNLSFSYQTSTGHSVPVLSNVNLEISSGELVAIQGPSGSGKSTLLYILGGLLTSYTGTVEVGGHDLSTLGDQALAFLRNRHIGFVFQQFHLLPKATVTENILLSSHYPAENPRTAGAAQRAESLMNELGLSERKDHFPNQLSGGQQQRVSIARALLNDTQIILADEPTGSLDTVNSMHTMQLLKQANRAGRTVIVITHDAEIAKQCQRVVHFRDGQIIEADPTLLSSRRSVLSTAQAAPERVLEVPSRGPPITGVAATISRYARMALLLFPLAWRSLSQNRSRSLLTMLGIVIGVAAVLSMMTVGSFTKRKILDSYAEMGVNTVVLYGNSNWELRATDQVAVVFQSFDWGRDLVPLKKVFPDVERLSPLLSSWDNKVSYGGKTVDNDVRAYGVSADGFDLLNRKVILGRGFSPFHVEFRSPVCVIGSDIFERLFSNVSPIGQIVYVNQRESSFGCRVIGVLSPQTSNKEWNKPNSQVFLPYTFFQGTSDPWNSRIRQILMHVRPGADIELTGNKVKAFFDKKYGKSARFTVGSDSVLIAQMNRFLSLFTLLLTAIALVSLGVGGIGITNMMLVSVNERFKEIGIRKAFGATNFSIRVQYLVESVVICGLAGFIGLIVGFVLYQSAIFGATKLVPKLHYEWTFDAPALLLSLVSIFGVGILSGLTPALKAEKLQVIEALRSE